MNPVNYPSEEYRLLDSIKELFNFNPNQGYILGAGDDAAIRLSNKDESLILTSDTLVENVHFSFEYMSLADVGYKAMVANLSDCAAMGAIPDSALVQIVVPYKCNKVGKKLWELYSGINRSCKKWHFPIVGGNLSRGPCWIIAVSFLGRKSADTRILKRSNAEIGDDLWVTGTPGMSSAGLEALRIWDRDSIPEDYREIVKCHITPLARVETGLKLLEDLHVHAVIDLSDGISKECYTLCYENQVGILLSLPKNIMPPVIKKLSKKCSKSWYKWFLNGGEDYELLFTASEGFSPLKYKEVKLNRIGKVTDIINSVNIIDNKGNITLVDNVAWDHF